MKLKSYMGFSQCVGSCEGAILIYAHNAKEAKKIGWKANTFIPDLCGDEFTDFRVRLLKEPWIMDQLKKDGPHVIESPITCKKCEYWGLEMIGSLCIDCHEEQENDKS